MDFKLGTVITIALIYALTLGAIKAWAYKKMDHEYRMKQLEIENLFNIDSQELK